MTHITRRRFLSATAAGAIASAAGFALAPKRKALVAITLDLEMSAEYPKRGMTEWNYRKGELDTDTKWYAVNAAKVAKDRGGRIHFFAVGRTLEQQDVGWLKDLTAAGHPVGNHTYDHVNVKATKPDDVQFRFKRAPWLIRDKPAILSVKYGQGTIVLFGFRIQHRAQPHGTFRLLSNAIQASALDGR